MADVNIKKKFLSNTGWQMAQQIYSMILSLIIGAVSARYLGPSNYGLLNYGATLIMITGSITSLGLDEIIMNALVMHKDKRGVYIGTALILRLFASVIGVFVIAGVIVVLEPQNKVLWVITILQSMQLFGTLYMVFNYWFQVELKSKFVSIAYIIGLTISGAWRVLLLVMNASVNFFAFTASLQGFIVLIIVALCYFKVSDEKLKWNADVAKNLLRQGYHYILSGIAVMIYMQMDKVMVGKILGEEQLGFYSAASHIANLWLFVPKAIINSARPIVLDGKNIEKETSTQGIYMSRLVRLVFAMIVLGILVGICFTSFGWLVVKVLYGNAFMAAVPVLIVLIWATTLSQLGTINGIWIASEGYNRLLKYTVWAGAIANLVSNFLLIPLLGIVGAAIGTLLAQVVVQFIAPAFSKDLRQYFSVYFCAICEFKNIKKYANSSLILLKGGRKKK